MSSVFLDNALESVEQLFYKTNFNAVRYVLRGLTGSHEQEDEEYQRISQYKSTMDTAIQKIIDQDYGGFNYSMRNFSKIYGKFHEIRENVHVLRGQAESNCKLLRRRKENMKNMFLKKLETEKILEMLEQIQSIHTAPSKLAELMTQKKFVDAANHLIESLESLFSESMVAIDAVANARMNLMESKQILEDRLMEELQNSVYIKFEMEKFSKSQYTLESFYQALHIESSENKELLSNKDIYPQAPDTNAATSLRGLVKAIEIMRRTPDAKSILRNSLKEALQNIVVQMSRFGKDCLLERTTQVNMQDEFTSRVRKKDTVKLITIIKLIFCAFYRIYCRSHLLAQLLDPISKDSKQVGAYTSEEIAIEMEVVIEEFLSKYLGVADHVVAPDNEKLANNRIIFKFETNRLKEKVETATKSSTSTLSTSNDTPLCEASIYHLTEIHAPVLLFISKIQGIVGSIPSPLTSYLHKVVTTHFIPCLTSDVENSMKQILLDQNESSIARQDTNLPINSTLKTVEIFKHISQCIEFLPSYMSLLVPIIEKALLLWINKYSQVLKEVVNGTFIDKRVKKLLKELTHALRGSSLYQQAKAGSPIPEDGNLGKGGKYSVPSNERYRIEYDQEKEFYDFSSLDINKEIFLFDTTKLSSLGSLSYSADYIAEFIVVIIDRLSTSIPVSMMDKKTFANLQLLGQRCSALSDEALFFIRKELRLHCFVTLSQICLINFDLDKEIHTSQDFIHSLNRDLVLHQTTLNRQMPKKKVEFVFEDLDNLIPRLLITSLRYNTGKIMTMEGIQQMKFNLLSLKQNLINMFYIQEHSTNNLQQDFSEAQIFYGLLGLGETDLERYIRLHKEKYDKQDYRAIWMMATPYRTPTNDSFKRFEAFYQ